MRADPAAGRRRREPPPALEQIPEGEPGEGQYLLPLEQNGKAVDLDLVNNIMEEPYPDRFRLILNDLGAGLAARGEELAEIIERSNPALRETNEVLAILARQNQHPRAASRATPTRSSSALAARARERRRLHQRVGDDRGRRPPSAATTSRRASRASRASCASCARR